MTGEVTVKEINWEKDAEKIMKAERIASEHR
jgi:hypothetical protein